MAQLIKNLPAMREIWVGSLGWEDPLEEYMAAHSSILVWRILMDRGAWWAIVHGVIELYTTEQLKIIVIRILLYSTTYLVSVFPFAFLNLFSRKVNLFLCFSM